MYKLEDTGIPLFSSDPAVWYTLRTSIDFRHESIERGRWPGSHTLRPTGVSPYLEVQHNLKIALQCVLDGVNGAPETRELLQFSVPVEFVQTRPQKATVTIEMHDGSARASQFATMPPLVPYDLPVYSHLYYSNGDRKLDHSEQLPLYSPKQLSPLFKLTGEDAPKPEGF
jgi:hypothetical protein